MEAHGDNYPKKQKMDSYEIKSKTIDELKKELKINTKEGAEGVDLQKVGMKYDKGKLRYELMPPASLAGVVRILTFGAEKYADYNWKLVEPVSRYYGALLRHLEAVREGEWLDPESGQPHLDHVLCNAVFLRELKWKGE